MAFKSNAPRFNDKVIDEETYIGPGYYEQKSGFEQSRNKQNGSRQRMGAASTQASLNQTRSMQLISSVGTASAVKKVAGQESGSTLKRRGGAGAIVTPGPGHYSSPDLNHWFKKSYNQNFNEV